MHGLAGWPEDDMKLISAADRFPRRQLLHAECRSARCGQRRR